MVFSDPIFLIVFLPAVIFLYRTAAHRFGAPAAQWFLILGSLFFYAFWRIEWLPLLAGSVLANYVLGSSLLRAPRRRVLFVGILLNLFPLFLVKYAGWLTGFQSFIDLALPLGISFFTFQQIAFLVDAYHQRASSYSLRDYSLFVTFFPQLIAGPIVHHKEMISQFQIPAPIAPEQTFKGLMLLTVGLFKKVVLADNLAPYANIVFDGTGAVSFYEAWTAAIAYSLQLYFDFSGYCEMAMGIALLLGFRLPINFDSPYRSLSISDFWRRWHITLGRFFRNYVYIPLGGNRHGAPRLFLALLLTALLSGIWHGAGVTFVVWGLIHGTALVLHKAWSSSGGELPDRIALVVMVFFAIFSWVVFRAPSLDIAVSIWSSMLGLNGHVHTPLTAQISGTDGPVLNTVTGLELPLMTLLLWYCATKPNVHEIDLQPRLRTAGAYSLACVVVFFSITSVSDFLYWSF